PSLGLGKRLGGKLRELAQTGTMKFYVELKADLPPAVESLMAVNGVGPKLALRLHNELSVNSPAELADAARRGQVIKLKGFGPKRQASYAQIQGPNPPTAPNVIALPRIRNEEELPAAA